MSAREVGRLSFGGQRFAGHAFPLASGPELAVFEELVRETARWLYHLEHPDASRVPNHFDDLLALRFRSVEEGSAVLPLEPVSASAGPLGFAEGLSYLERSVALITHATNAANAGDPLPPSFPRSALSVFDSFGKSLADDEWIGITSRQGDSCRYTSVTRQRFLDTAATSYDDTADVVGYVTAADVRRHQFTLTLLPDRPQVTVPFTDEQEPLILDALRRHREQRIRVVGRGSFTPSGALQRIILVDSVTAGEQTASEQAPIWDILLSMASEVPEEESAKLPSDLAEDLDHYLYGARRRS